MAHYKNVEYIKPLGLFSLMFLTFIVFILSFFLVLYFHIDPLISSVTPLISAFLFFLLIKRKFVKQTNFKISSKWFEMGDKRIKFEDIDRFKIYNYVDKAYLKIYFKNNEKLILFSNRFYCNMGQFISMSINLESQLLKFSIKRIKLFGETKFTDYFMKSMIIFIFILSIGAIIFCIITKNNMIINIPFLSIISCALWCGLIRNFTKFKE